MSRKYLLNSGINIHIAVNKDQFVEFEIISGKVSGIAEEPLDVVKSVNVELMHSKLGYPSLATLKLLGYLGWSIC